MRSTSSPTAPTPARIGAGRALQSWIQKSGSGSATTRRRPANSALPLLRVWHSRAAMDELTPIRHTAGCGIDQGPGYIRASVGPGLADQVQECYRAFVNECLQRQCGRALILGRAKD